MLTPIEAQVVMLLNDGHPHRADELATCGCEDAAAAVAVLRTKLRPLGQDVVLSEGRYRLVRLTASHARA